MTIQSENTFLRFMPCSFIPTEPARDSGILEMNTAASIAKLTVPPFISPNPITMDSGMPSRMIPNTQQDLLSLTKGTVAVNLIEVYKSLGGGWEIRENMDPVDLLPSEMKEQMRQRTKDWKGVLK